jgi:hypothetical protein
MNAFINDELINIICLIINYYNNDFIRNLWFTYVDYYNINSNVYILFITVVVISSLLLYSVVKILYNLRFITPYFQILLRHAKYLVF